MKVIYKMFDVQNTIIVATNEDQTEAVIFRNGVFTFKVKRLHESDIQMLEFIHNWTPYNMRDEGCKGIVNFYLKHHEGRPVWDYKALFGSAQRFEDYLIHLKLSKGF